MIVSPLTLLVIADDGALAHREVGQFQIGLRRAYLLPFLVLRRPLRLPMDSGWLPTLRQ